MPTKETVFLLYAFVDMFVFAINRNYSYVSDGTHIALGCHDNDIYIYEFQSEGKSVSLKARCKVRKNNIMILAN